MIARIIAIIYIPFFLFSCSLSLARARVVLVHVFGVCLCVHHCLVFWHVYLPCIPSSARFRSFDMGEKRKKNSRRRNRFARFKNHGVYKFEMEKKWAVSVCSEDLYASKLQLNWRLLMDENMKLDTKRCECTKKGAQTRTLFDLRKGSQLFIRNKINKFNLWTIIHSVHVFMHPIIIIFSFCDILCFVFFFIVRPIHYTVCRCIGLGRCQILQCSHKSYERQCQNHYNFTHSRSFSLVRSFRIGCRLLIFCLFISLFNICRARWKERVKKVSNRVVERENDKENMKNIGERTRSSYCIKLCMFYLQFIFSVILSYRTRCSICRCIMLLPVCKYMKLKSI